MATRGRKYALPESQRNRTATWTAQCKVPTCKEPTRVFDTEKAALTALRHHYVSEHYRAAPGARR